MHAGIGVAVGHEGLERGGDDTTAKRALRRKRDASVCSFFHSRSKNFSCLGTPLYHMVSRSVQHCTMETPWLAEFGLASTTAEVVERWVRWPLAPCAQGRKPQPQSKPSREPMTIASEKLATGI